MGHHKRKHQYSIKDFKRDILKPIGHTAMHVERDVVGVYKSGFNALGKFGSSLGSIGMPLIIIGGAVVIYVVATNKR